MYIFIKPAIWKLRFEFETEFENLNVKVEVRRFLLLQYKMK